VRPAKQCGKTPPLDVTKPKSTRFSHLAWAALAYTLLVVLFGAVVRITGSGAGCGQHWPSCQGEIVHLPRSLETAIEYTHRLTSGAALLVVLALAVLARRSFAPGHLARRAANWALVLMLVEALIGAALVLLELVGRNDSAARAAVMAAHLVNTSLLTAALALSAWSGAHTDTPTWRLERGSALLFAAALAGVLFVSVTGAVTALGDTLYPLPPGADLSVRLGHAQGHFLAQLRVVHPVLASLVGVLVAYYALVLQREAGTPGVRRGARTLLLLVVLQVGAGIMNVLLSAPAWLQVVHLAIATLVWLSLVLLGAARATSLESRLESQKLTG
jgi:heme A synthase